MLQDFFTASDSELGLSHFTGRLRLSRDASLKQWVAIAAIAILGGCSWFSDEPEPPAAKPVTISTNGNVPDASTVPAQAPAPIISSVEDRKSVV